MSTLEDIKARLAAATRWPWEVVGRSIEPVVGGEEVVSCDVECSSYCYGGTGQGIKSDADAVFIANAPTDIARLIAALENVHALCKDSDGNWLPSDFDGNTVGDICRAIYSALEQS